MEDLLSIIDQALSEVISILPNSPFVSYLNMPADSDIIQVLKWVNYFVDVPTMIVIGELWLVSIAGYFIVSVILRAVKAVQ